MANELQLLLLLLLVLLRPLFSGWPSIYFLPDLLVPVALFLSSGVVKRPLHKKHRVMSSLLSYLIYGRNGEQQLDEEGRTGQPSTDGGHFGLFIRRLIIFINMKFIASNLTVPPCFIHDGTDLVGETTTTVVVSPSTPPELHNHDGALPCFK